jgi:hypothetical protein
LAGIRNYPAWEKKRGMLSDAPRDLTALPLTLLCM